MNAYHIQKHLTNVEHVIYEKNHDIGGTWLENRYPGCACDIPSHAYTYPFALNPDWPRFCTPHLCSWPFPIPSSTLVADALSFLFPRHPRLPNQSRQHI